MVKNETFDDLPPIPPFGWLIVLLSFLMMIILAPIGIFTRKK